MKLSRYLACLLVFVFVGVGCNTLHKEIPVTAEEVHRPLELVETPTVADVPLITDEPVPRKNVSPVPTQGPVVTVTPTVAQVTKPRNVGGFHAGMSVLVYGNDPYLEEKSRQLLPKLVELNVNSIAIAFPVYQDHWQANHVRKGVDTPTEENLSVLIREAHRRGFTVMLRPILDEKSLIPDGQWRGSIQPQNRSEWFKSYTQLMVDYAMFCEENHVEILGIGTEFTSLEGETAHWKELIGEVKDVYSGQLIYASNWSIPASTIYSRVQFWEELDYVGVDAFFPLEVPLGSGVKELEQAWQKWLDQIDEVEKQTGNPIIFTELGTTSQRGSYQRPWGWVDESLPISLEDQRIYYEASCAAVAETVQGIYWWEVPPSGAPKVPEEDRGFNPLGKPAEDALRECFRTLYE